MSIETLPLPPKPPPEPASTPLMRGARIARSTSALLTAAFVLLIAIPPFCQAIARPLGEARRFAKLLHQHLPPNGKDLSGFAEEVSRESMLARLARRYYQLALTCGLHQGSSKVVIGRDGYLFWRDDLNLCTGTAIFDGRSDARQRQLNDAGSRSLECLIDYDRQVRAAGIHLVIVPVPLAPVLYPEKIWPGYPAESGPAWSPDYFLWKKRLAGAGVDVLDVSDVLGKAKADTETPWVPHNTHWSPHGVELVGGRIAEHIRPWLGRYPSEKYTTRKVTGRVISDVATLLDLPRPCAYPPFACQATQVLHDGEVASGADDAPVLLLGDSFTWLYSGLGKEEDDIAGADLGRQIMRAAAVPVQTLTEYGVDPLNARALLWTHATALRSKKVIVWEFAARHLAHRATWAPMPFPPLHTR